eukprot:760403-Hanusia_phi.AAC.4
MVAVLVTALLVLIATIFRLRRPPIIKGGNVVVQIAKESPSAIEDLDMAKTGTHRQELRNTVFRFQAEKAMQDLLRRNEVTDVDHKRRAMMTSAQDLEDELFNTKAVCRELASDLVMLRAVSKKGIECEGSGISLHDKGSSGIPFFKMHLLLIKRQIQ